MDKHRPRKHLHLVRPEISADRRKDERYLIRDMLDGFVIGGPQAGDIEVQLDNISLAGLSFFIKHERDCQKTGQHIHMNLFIKYTAKYFQCEFLVKNVKKDEQGRFRHSLEVRDYSKNREALEFLVRFIQSVKIMDTEKVS